MSIPNTYETGSPFTITCRRLEDADKAALHAAGFEGDGFVMALTGELDLATAPVVEEELKRAEVSQDLIVLDLRGLTFIDSSGLRLIVGADRRARARDGGFVVVQAPPHARRLFDLSGVTGHLQLIDEVAAQVAPTD